MATNFYPVDHENCPECAKSPDLFCPACDLAMNKWDLHDLGMRLFEMCMHHEGMDSCMSNFTNRQTGAALIKAMRLTTRVNFLRQLAYELVKDISEILDVDIAKEQFDDLKQEWAQMEADAHELTMA